MIFNNMSFTSDQREIKSGRAYLEVTSNSGNPDIINLNNLNRLLFCISNIYAIRPVNPDLRFGEILRDFLQLPHLHDDIYITLKTSLI